MNFLKKLISKQEHELSEEERVRLDSILDDGTSKSKTKKSEDSKSTSHLEDFVKSLNLGQINRLRELIDEREAELYTVYGLENNSKKEFEDNLKFEKPVKKVESKIVNIEEDITDEDLNDKTIEVKDMKKIRQSKPSLDNIVIEEEVVEESVDEDEFIEYEDSDIKVKNENNVGNDIVEKLRDIFGAENIFFKEGVSSKHPSYKDKDIFMIGIRKFDADDKKETPLDQNAWFISHIKKFDKLKDFKMVISKPEEKELFCDSYDEPVSINYKATQLLKNKVDFDF